MVQQVDTKTTKKITKSYQILNVGVSSKPLFVFSVDKIDKENFVLTILDLESLSLVHIFESIKSATFFKKYECPLVKYKRDNWPLLKFDGDDKVAFKKTSQECIEILDASKNFEILRTYQIEKFNFFYVSPGVQLTLVFTFVEVI